jgi:copper homeostasis protein
VTRRILIEACVDSIDSALAAQAGGAGRIELCANLLEGGTTPSPGTIRACRTRLRIPLFVLIRARGGDFLFSEAEQEAMLHDIGVARDLGADGVVIGALRPEGRIDEARTTALIRAARPLAVTFHRAFDLCRDPAESLEVLIGLGVDRVLTAGHAPSAGEGISTLAALVRQSAGRIIILAGGGLDEASVRAVVAGTGVTEVHVRATAPVASAMRHRESGIVVGKPFTPDDYTRMVTDADRLRGLAAILAASE